MSVFLKISGMILLMFCLSLVNFGQWSLNLLKLYLNLRSLKWRRATWRLVRKIYPFGWETLKTSLLRGLIKSKILLLKVKYEADLRISDSNLFHLINVDKKRINEKVVPYVKLENHQVLIISYLVRIASWRIKLYKYFRDCSLTIL